jgi:hypothetical protein
MSRLRARAVILLAVGALAGCGGGRLAGRTGGLYGTVTRGPTSPVCRAGVPCSEPASGAQLIFTRNGNVAARVVVGKDGRYSVSLAPGAYGVAVTPQPPTGHGINASVSVTAGQRRKVDFRIDTGIR